MPNRRRGLEIDENLDIERRHWIYERIVWSLMFAVVLAGVLGVFGSGVLSRATAAASATGLRVEYRRFSRAIAPTRLRFHVPPGSASGGNVRLWIGSAYLHDVDVQQVTPPPERVELGSDRLTYVFRSGDSAAAAEIVFVVEPQSWGELHGLAGIGGGEPVAFAQIIFP
jgi:hypothetical protein